MDFEIKIMTPAERSYCYTGSQQLDKQAGCIGHLRGDMDRSGNGFFTSWEDHCGELKTQAFKDEFDDFINALRFDERYDGIFKNRSSLSRYCYEHKESVFAEDFIPQYGFRVDTPEYAYLLRLNPMQGDYNLYIYCYRREMLEQHMEKAARGICFLDASGKERFRIPDGDSTTEQLENARTEMTAPFPKEAELAEKTRRLNELNVLLNLNEQDRPVMADEPDEGDRIRPKNAERER